MGGKSENSSKRRLYLKIMEQIEQAIKMGKYQIGSRLPPEQKLAELFQVSRPTIREATLALEVRGLVEARIGSGIYVLPIENSDTDSQTIDIIQNEPVSPFEILEARELVEVGAIVSAIAGANRSDLLRLKQNLSLQRELLRNCQGGRPSKEFLELDEDFHMQIALMTQNLAIYQVIRLLWDKRTQSPLWIKLNEHFGQEDIQDFQRAIDDHEAIAQALELRNGELAKSLLSQHFTNVKQCLIELAGTDEIYS